MKLRMMLLSAAGLLFSLSSLAATCKNANGGISMVNYDLTPRSPRIKTSRATVQS